MNFGVALLYLWLLLLKKVTYDLSEDAPSKRTLMKIQAACIPFTCNNG